MKVNEKIRFLRETKNWSQEEMANKLGMSTNGYSKIERGETRLSMPKLEQIVEVFDTDILELMSLGERNVVFFQESDHNLNIIGSSQELSTEITLLKKEISYYQEIIKHKDQLIESPKQEIFALKKLLDIGSKDKR